MVYKIKTDDLDASAKVIIRENADGSISSFGQNVSNRDYEEYLEWVAEGNTAEDAD